MQGSRSIGPSPLPGDPAHLGLPGHRMGLRISRRVDPAARKVTKVATWIECNPAMAAGGLFEGDPRPAKD